MSRAALQFLPGGARGLSPNQAYQAALDLGWADARKYGKPGALNATTAQAAIDANITGTNDKPVLFVGDWDFGSGGPVTIPRTGTRTHAKIAGLGPGSTIIRTDGATAFDTDTDGVTGLEISGFRFIDEDTAVTAGAWALNLMRVADVWIDEIYATGYHNAIRLAYAQTYRIRNIVLRDPKDAVTAGDSAMLLLDNHDIGGPSFRRCINGVVENARIISGVSGDTTTKGNYPNVCVEVRGADGCRFVGGNWTGADAFVRIKMYDGQSVSGILSFEDVYMDGVNYTTDGVLIEPPDTTGSIGTVSFSGNTFIGNLDSGNGGGGGETTAIKATESVNILKLGPQVRLGGCDVGIDISQGTTETFETHAYVATATDGIRIDAGESNKIGGHVDGCSGNGVELTGTMGAVIWDNAVFTNCTALVSNSATITDERGNATSDDVSLTYFDNLQSGSFPAYTNDTPTVEFQTNGDAVFTATQHRVSYAISGKRCGVKMRIDGSVTHTTASGPLVINTSAFEPEVTEVALPIKQLDANYDASVDINAACTEWYCNISSDGAGGANIAIFAIGPGIAGQEVTASNFPTGTSYDWRGTFDINIK